MLDRPCCAIIATTLVLTLVGSPSRAALIDFAGYSWETGAFPTSEPGDQLVVVALVTGISEPLSWNPGWFEYTAHAHGLSSQGQIEMGENIQITYLGGQVDIYEDKNFDADYGILPPSAVAPGTFTNGDLYASFDVQTLILSYNVPFRSGAFQGRLAVTGRGTHAREVAAYASSVLVGGLFEFGVPDGYDLQWSGAVVVDTGLPVQASTWGAVKQHFRQLRAHPGR